MRRIALLLLAALACGCNTDVTETGYQPNKLGMTNTQRRALYAPKYSPEAAQAEAEKGSNPGISRPTFR